MALSTTDPLGGVTRFTCDPNGNLLFVADARGGAIAHAYDVMDRLASRTGPLGVESFRYDGLKQMKVPGHRPEPGVLDLAAEHLNFVLVVPN